MKGGGHYPAQEPSTVKLAMGYECFTKGCQAPAAITFRLNVPTAVTISVDAVVCSTCGEPMDEVIPER